MREKIARFMAGRYGMDSLGRFSITLALILVILNSFAGSRLLNTLFWLLLIYAYFRMLSRNVYKRSSENQLFLNKTAGIRRWFYTQKNRMHQRKTHHIYHCPSCKQKIRIPRGKGRIEIRCPKCSTTFIKKS